MKNFNLLFESAKSNSLRVLILGSPGAGKTAFAKKLGNICSNIPLYHLDDYYWSENWTRPSSDQWRQTVDNLCQNKSWIIDGNHHSTLDLRLLYASYIILLNYPTHLCFWWLTKRSLRRYLGHDDNLPIKIKRDTKHKAKFKLRGKLIKLVLFFKILNKPKILLAAEQAGCPIMILNSRAETNIFLAKLQSKKIE